MSELGDKVVTLNQIAAHVGLSRSTVSYALRHDPKIAKETQDLVAAAAASLGYRPNPSVANLMAHIRAAHGRPHAEKIAFVWVHTPRKRSISDPFMRLVFNGAQRRANQLGYPVEEFWTEDAGMTDQRLQGILRARGIAGVLLSPVVTGESTLSLDWDWSLFAPAVIGNVAWTPELHHAGHHHYLAMRRVLTELVKLGCRRPVAILERKTNDRAKQAWEAAFLAAHPDRARAPGLVRVAEDETPRELADWVRTCGADALVVSTSELLLDRTMRAAIRRQKLAAVSLHWKPELPACFGGIDQRYDRVAAHAVDLVVTQLRNNERGAPDLPSMILFPGYWVAPQGKAAAPRFATTQV